jgi:folate-binding Fe-S cluster repair protein YgfZ
MDYAILKISGADAEQFIETHSTRKIKDKLEIKAKGVYISVLEPKGKIKLLGYMLKTEAKTLELILDSHHASASKEYLEKFLICENAELELSDINLSLVELKSRYHNNLPKDFLIESYKENDTLIKLDLLDKYFPEDKGCFPGQEVLNKYKNIGLKKKQARSADYHKQAMELFISAVDEKKQEALELLEKALREDPKNYDALEAKGVMLAKQDKYHEAIKVMEELNEKQPNSIMAKTNLSIFYMKLGDKEKAEEYKAQATVAQFEQALSEN